MKITDGTRVLAAQQCPNCGGWYRLGSCFHSSSGPLGTLYGVCEDCAEKHRKWAEMTQQVIDMLEKERNARFIRPQQGATT